MAGFFYLKMLKNVCSYGSANFFGDQYFSKQVRLKDSLKHIVVCESNLRHIVSAVYSILSGNTEGVPKLYRWSQRQLNFGARSWAI